MICISTGRLFICKAFRKPHSGMGSNHGRKIEPPSTPTPPEGISRNSSQV